jgi:hypothetical protein
MLHALHASAGKPGSDAAHYHSNQQERIRVKQGKLGYYIGHHSHVQAAEAGEEVIIKPGELGLQHAAHVHRLLVA